MSKARSPRGLVSITMGIMPWGTAKADSAAPLKLSRPLCHIAGVRERYSGLAGWEGLYSMGLGSFITFFRFRRCRRVCRSGWFVRGFGSGGSFGGFRGISGIGFGGGGSGGFSFRSYVHVGR